MALVGNISGSSAYSSNIGISGSVVIANRPDALFPTLSSIGGDVVFFVSGSRGGKGSTAARTVSVFGGDAVVSGSLTIGTGSVTITSNDVQFNAFDTRIESGSGGLTFFDAGNTVGVTLSSLAGSSGDVVGPASSTTNAIAAYADTTGNLLKDTGVTIDASNNVIIPGNLTVNGTTTTIDTVNLIVEDPVIYFGSGSEGENRNGGIALASGSSVTDQALVWGRVADDTWGAGRLDVTNGTETNLTGMSLLPVRASKFELGGSTAFVTSSDGTNISITHGSTSTTTFTKAGTPLIQIGNYPTSDEGQIMGLATGNALAPLWLSGSAINIGSPAVAFLVNDIQQATIKPQTGGAGVRFEGQDGTGAPRAMVISGSQTTIGANNRLVVLEGSGVPFLTASSNAGFNTVSLTPGAGFTTANIAHDVATTVNFAANASLEIARTVNLGTGPASGAAAQTVNIGSTNTTSALTLQAGTGATTHTAGGAYDVNAVGAVTIDSSTSTIGIGTDAVNQNINIGTSGTRTVTVGSTASTSALTLDAGTGIINIGNSNAARTVNVGTGLAAQTVTVGSADTTSTLTLKGGTAVSLTGATATNYLVGITTGTGTITLGQSNATNTISIGAGAYADGSTQSINIGNGTLAGTTGRSVVTIGNNAAATAVNIAAGTGNVTIGGAVATNYTVGTTTGTGAITLGRSTDSNTISIGNANTADTKTQTINIGAGSPVSTGKAVITIGNTNGASEIDLKAGTGNIVAYANLLPDGDRTRDLGAAGSRWSNIYTGDLHLKNERGDYTLIEEEDFLSIRFNKTGKRYKFLLEPVPELDEK